MSDELRKPGSGGKRAGSGRHAGVPSVKTRRRIAAVEKSLSNGIAPIDVMLANMRHFHDLAETANEPLSEKAINLRVVSQSCARDAAPYCHPKLSTIEQWYFARHFAGKILGGSDGQDRQLGREGSGEP
jgi:hypothetical protein